MYPDLSYLFHDIFGSEVDNWTSVFKTFGLMLATAFAACAWLLRSELKRMEAEGLVHAIKKRIEPKKGDWKDLAVNALILGVLAAKLPVIISEFDAFKGDPASVLFSSSGKWFIGILVAIAVFAYFKYFDKKEEIAEPRDVLVSPHTKTMDIIFVAAISGVAGAKLFSILENLDSFFADPLGQLFSGSGLTAYGGFILAFFVVLRYVKKNGIPALRMMDIGGMGILLGYGIGRIGCQLSGDGDWGIEAAMQPDWWILPDWLWSYNYPNNVANDGILLSQCDPQAFKATFEQGRMAIEDRCQTACGIRYCHELIPKVYPTPVYETVLSLVGVGFLWLIRRRIQHIAGLLFFLYMIYAGVERFFIEGIRVNERYDFFGFDWSQAQYISIGFIVVGLAGAAYLWKKSREVKEELS